MKRKGVCYDVGRVLEGSLQRSSFDPRIIHRELEIIKNDLHCNAVRIQGLDIDRLATASEDALNQGLEVWFSPEMFEKSPEETLAYLVRAAESAETLRRKSPNLIFSLGSELTLFMQGILEGNNLLERMSNPSFRETIVAGRHNKPLNDFLSRANESVRGAFHGKLTYFSVPFEQVDWRLLDFVGVDLYRSSGMNEMYERMLRKSFTHGKPVVIGEFGCCTFEGAEKLGGQGWAIAFGMMSDLQGSNATPPRRMVDLLKIPSRVDGHYVRDEELQARELRDQLGILDEEGVEGAFVFTFVSPESHFSEDPRFDFDLPSYSLVRSYPEKGNTKQIEEEIAKYGREIFGIDLPAEVISKLASNVGRHGETYPEVSWEPKVSFKAVGDYYASH